VSGGGVDSARHRDREVDWFNKDHNYSRILSEVLLLKTQTMNKLSYWMEQKKVWSSNHAQQSNLECARLIYGRKFTSFCDAKEKGDIAGMHHAWPLSSSHFSTILLFVFLLLATTNFETICV
jgi:hypothetical protein